MFYRYNKRINDIRECKEQALSHAYVLNLFANPLFVFLFVPAHKTYFTFPEYFSAHIFILFIYSFPSFCLPTLTIVLTLPVALSFSLRESQTETSPPSYLYPHSVYSSCSCSSPLCLPGCLNSAFILITYSVFPFHLHSHSSAVSVICLLLSSLQDRPESVKMQFNRDAGFVLIFCSDFLRLPAEAPCTERDASFCDQP